MASFLEGAPHEYAPRPVRGVFDRRVYQPDRLDPEPRARADEPSGLRRYDPLIRCWVLVQPDEPPRPKVPGPAPRPRNDGSGIWWEITDAGQPLWRIEAANFERALVEKRRLCRESGFRPGHARLREVA